MTSMTLQAALLKDRFNVLDHLRVTAQHHMTGLSLDRDADLSLQLSACERICDASLKAGSAFLAARGQRESRSDRPVAQ